MVQTRHHHQSRRQSEIGIVLDKYGKNKIKIAVEIVKKAMPQINQFEGDGINLFLAAVEEKAKSIKPESGDIKEEPGENPCEDRPQCYRSPEEPKAAATTCASRRCPTSCLRTPIAWAWSERPVQQS